MTLYLLKHRATGAYVVLDTRTTVGFTKNPEKIEEYDRLVIAFTEDHKELFRSMIEDHSNVKYENLVWETWEQIPVRPYRKPRFDI